MLSTSTKMLGSKTLATPRFVNFYKRVNVVKLLQYIVKKKLLCRGLCIWSRCTI